MEKMTHRSFDKIGRIIEIMMPLLNCDYSQAHKILKTTRTYRAIYEGDGATLYQSAACCVEDIGRELCAINSPYATYFTNERINFALDQVRDYNIKLRERYVAL